MKGKTLIQKLVPTLFEDDRFLVVDKPAGIDVGGMPEKGVTGLVELFATLRTADPPLHVVNRLSRYESGALILAKDGDSAAFVRHALRAQKVEQDYLAIVTGGMRERRMTLDAGEAGSSGRPQKGNAGSRRAGVAAPHSSTTISRIEQFDRRALIRCRTSVATTHALRAQLRAVRLRLLGDNVHDRGPRRQQNADTHLHLAKATFHHPALRTRVGVVSPVPEAFSAIEHGGLDIDRLLRPALVRRLEVLMESDTDCCRLLCGGVEGLPGVNVEKFGNVLIVQVIEERYDQREFLIRIAKWLREMLDVRAVYAKPYVRERGGADEALARRLTSSRPLWGDPVAEQIEVRERGLRLAIRPYDGFNVGLFLDQRENRSRVRELARDGDVLNLFAYTCGFSVAAAAGGAKGTVSVDVSPKSLEWGRRNFALNGVDPANHLFVRSEAADYLKRAKRQGKSFDLIVIDPPSFAHGRGSGRDFSIMTDLPSLVGGAVDVLRLGGTILVSINYRKMSASGLRERVLRGFGGRERRVVAMPPLPPDFAMDRDHSKTIIVRS